MECFLMKRAESEVHLFRRLFARCHAIEQTGLLTLRLSCKEDYPKVLFWRTDFARYHAMKQIGCFMLKLPERGDRKKVVFQRSMFV